MDGYNDLFRPTVYPSYRYENDRFLRGHIPPYDMALARLLMPFDGHYMRNDFKLLATTQYRHFNHIMTPDMINFPNGYHCKVPNMALNDFRNMLKYYTLSGWMPESYEEWEVESLYMETQGNWWAFHETYLRDQRIGW